MPVRRKTTKESGRPPLTREQRGQRAEQGRALAKALDALGIPSQAEASRRSGIPQGTLNQILNGRRWASKEDLRSLQAIDVSADYILGARVPMRLSDRGLDRGTLEGNLAERVTCDALAKAGQEIDPKLREEFQAKIDGSALLQFLVDMAAEDVRARAPFYRGIRETLSARATIGVAVHRLNRGGLAELAAEVKGALAVLERRLDAPPPAGRAISWQSPSSRPAPGKRKTAKRSRAQ